MGCNSAAASQGGGIKSEVFDRKTTAEKMSIIKSTQKELTKAKTAETKAKNKYLLASGAVIMTYADDKENLRKRRKLEAKAERAYSKAIKARQKIETRLERYADVYRGQTTLF